jgi:glycosyltransferase involved in cell wall biosynthesis
MLVEHGSFVVAVGSRNFFGAERRFLKLVGFIFENDESARFILVFNRALYLSALKVDWAEEILARLEQANVLVVVPDSLTSLLKWRNPFGLLKIFSAASFRAVLHGRYVAWPRLLFGRRCIFELTSIDDASNAIRKTPKALLRRVAQFNCVSPNVENEARRLLAEVGLNSSAIRFSVDPAAFFLPATKRPDDNRARSRRIVFASRFIPRKNALLFARVAKRFLSIKPGWDVSICGRGPDEEKIREILVDEIQSGAAFVGYNPKMEETLLASQIYVSIIERDNYPSQSVLEAMYAGNALLLSDVGQSARFLDDQHRNGRLVPIDEDQILAALVEMTADEDSLKEKGRCSRRLVDERFSANIYMKKFLDVTFGREKRE